MHRKPAFTNLATFALILFLSAACGGEGGLLGSSPLNEEECRQLLIQIEEITFADLSAEEREMAASTPEELEADVRECLEDPAWDRPGFECVMKATTDSDLRRCIMDG